MAVDQHDQDERRRLNQGFGAALTNAFEIALVPAIFAGLGWLADRLLGTGWVCTAAFAVLGLVGTFVKLYYRYVHDMQKIESAGSWNAAPQPSGPQAKP